MKEKLFGVIPPIITPIDENEHVDEKALRDLINGCIENGIHAIFVCGSNGECLALTQEQRNRAIEIALDECKGRVPCIAGCMDSSTERVIENIKEFEKMGGEYAVVTPVFYARHATQDETVQHFAEISRRTNAKLLIYNIPSFTGQNLLPETVYKLAKIDKVIGIKDTSGNFANFTAMLNHFRGTDFLLFQGATNLAVPSMLMGADGFVPSLAPLFPVPHIKLYDAGKNGNIEETMKWGKVVDSICKIYPMAKSQTASTKYAISCMGFCSDRACRPTEVITDAEKKNIDQWIENYKEYAIVS